MGIMKKYSYNIITIFFILKLITIIFSFQSQLLAGAPPMNKDPIPSGPYSFNKTKHLIVGVEWEKSFLQKFLPSNYQSISTITGGINIFNSKKKQPYSPLSGSFGWVDLPGKNNEEKLIIFSIYGPNKTINDIMKSVYNLESKMGSNKVTLINDNAVATSSIENKNVIIISASDSENCKESSGRDFYISQYSKKNLVRKIFLGKQKSSVI